MQYFLYTTEKTASMVYINCMMYLDYRDVKLKDCILE